MAKEYTGSEYIDVIDSSISIKPDKIIDVQAGPGIKINYPDDKIEISVDLTDEQVARLKGPKGDSGKDGADGKDGRDGVDGKDGRDGVDGKDGKDGTPGLPGAPGVPGAPGAPGKSVVLTPITNGVNINLEGSESAGYNIVNGQNGSDGNDGQGISNIIQETPVPATIGGEAQTIKIFVGDNSYDVTVYNGLKGDKGDTGEGFSIFKTFSSVNAMINDRASIPEGAFVIIASSSEDEDNAKLFVRANPGDAETTGFSFLTDMSGAQGIKGETGKSVSITTDSTLPKITFTVPQHDETAEQTTSIQAEKATPETGRGDGVSLTVGNNSVTIHGGADIEVSDVTDGITIKPSNKTTGKDITVKKTNTVTTLAVGNKTVNINDGISPTASSEDVTDEVTGKTGTKVSITYDGEESPEEFTVWNGKTWLPSVSEAGDLSWTQSDSETAPTPRNIKGPKGDKGSDASVTTEAVNALTGLTISTSGNAATATKATGDSDGNNIKTTYVKKTGDIMTGRLSVQAAGGDQTKVADGALVVNITAAKNQSGVSTNGSVFAGDLDSTDSQFVGVRRKTNSGDKVGARFQIYSTGTSSTSPNGTAAFMQVDYTSKATTKSVFEFGHDYGKNVDNWGTMTFGSVTKNIAYKEDFDTVLNTTSTSAPQTKVVKVAIDSHTTNTSNPHNVTAEQVGAYTKEQVDDFIRNWSGYVVIPYGQQKPDAKDAELGKIYLVQISNDPTVNDKFEEWISDGSAWSLIGERSVNLEGYVNGIKSDTTDTFGDESTIVVRKDGSNILTRTALKLWNYIKVKADAVYSAIGHQHSGSEITSKVGSATSADTATTSKALSLGYVSNSSTANEWVRIAFFRADAYQFKDYVAVFDVAYRVLGGGENTKHGTLTWGVRANNTITEPLRAHCSMDTLTDFSDAIDFKCVGECDDQYVYAHLYAKFKRSTSTGFYDRIDYTLVNRNDVNVGDLQFVSDNRSTVEPSSQVNKACNWVDDVTGNAATASKVSSTVGTGNIASLSDDGNLKYTYDYFKTVSDDSNGNMLAIKSTLVRRARIRMQSKNTNYHAYLRPVDDFTADREFLLPNAGGTLALTSSNITGTASAAHKLNPQFTTDLVYNGDKFNGGAGNNYSNIIAAWSITTNSDGSLYTNYHENFLYSSRHSGSGILSVYIRMPGGAGSFTIDTNPVAYITNYSADAFDSLNNTMYSPVKLRCKKTKVSDSPLRVKYEFTMYAAAGDYNRFKIYGHVNGYEARIPINTADVNYALTNDITDDAYGAVLATCTFSKALTSASADNCNYSGKSSADTLVVKRTDTGGGAYVKFCPKNQETKYWRVGSDTERERFTFQVDGTTKAFIDTNGNYSGNAATATKATQDESGNDIKASYGVALSLSGNNVNLVNKNGATISSATVQYATNAGSATAATNDSSGNNIANTYGATLANSGNNLQLKNKAGTVVSSLTVGYASKAADSNTIGGKSIVVSSTLGGAANTIYLIY